MSFVKVWIHAVCGTKNRYPFFSANVKDKVIAHIKQNARAKQIYIDAIDGDVDHLHILMALNADRSISTTMQLIKGESAFWINKQKITPVKFTWADAYYATSVSESVLPSVRLYIWNQENHHHRITFSEQVDSFLKSQEVVSQG